MPWHVRMLTKRLRSHLKSGHAVACPYNASIIILFCRINHGVCRKVSAAISPRHNFADRKSNQQTANVMKKFFSNVLSSMVGTWIAMALGTLILIGVVAAAVASFGGDKEATASLEKSRFSKSTYRAPSTNAKPPLTSTSSHSCRAKALKSPRAS